jgi:hypothetical protein
MIFSSPRLQVEGILATRSELTIVTKYDAAPVSRRLRWGRVVSEMSKILRSNGKCSERIESKRREEDSMERWEEEKLKKKQKLLNTS